MANNSFESVVWELSELFLPVLSVRHSPSRAKVLLKALGYEPPPGADDIGLAVLDVQSLVEKAKAVAQASVAAREDEVEMAGRYAELAIAVGDVIQRVIDLANTLSGGLPATYLGSTNIAAELWPRLIDYLIISHFARRHPMGGAILHLVGIFESRPVEADPALFRPAHVRRKIHWDRIGTLFEDPQRLAEDVYGWGTADFDAWLLLQRIGDLLTTLTGPTQIRKLPASVERRFAGVAPPPGAPDLPQLIVGRRTITATGRREVGGSFHALRPTAPDDSNGGVGFFPWMRGEERFEIPIPGTDGILSMLIDTELSIEGGIHLVAVPGEPLRVDAELLRSPGEVVQSGRVGFGLRVQSPEGERFPVLSIPGGLAVELGGASILVGGEHGASAGIDGFFEAALQRGRIGVDVSKSDSFLSTLIPFEAIETEFDLAIGYSPSRGVFFRGAARLETEIGLHTDLGPFHLDVLHVGLGVSPQALHLDVGITGSGELGPIAVSVGRIGIRLELAFERGNLGPVDLRPSFLPPTALGLAIDAGPVAGGGFISLEPERGRYAGTLQLEILTVSVTAIGLLDTREESGAELPSPGFSFLLILTGRFPPIQLGYGFTLNGVGGLAGIHRTVVTEALQSSIRSGSVDHILFPEDPVRSAPQIISDLRTLFPPKADRHVFGPMAILGWGTPTLVEIELGILIELPEPIRIVLLGQLRLALPTPDAPIVRIQVDILGIVNFEASTFALDAILRDSYILAFALTGGMAFRLSWGESPMFALSMGGLHPHFPPPPNFPVLDRLGLALGTGTNPRLTLQAYFAVTANSFQFGARVELYAASGKFNVYGWVGFDALLIFVPFSFRADLSAGFALRVGTRRLAGIHVDATLTGPSPFHAFGKGCISILFFDVCVPFDATFGEEKVVELPDKDPWPELKAAMEDPRNWSAALPGSIQSAVTLRAPDLPDVPVLVHPMGTATMRQRVLPLNRSIDKVGELEPSDANRFDLAAVRIGDDPAGTWKPIDDYFAPGQFEKLSDTQKLSRPSFEKMTAGVAIGSERAEFGDPVRADVVYETKIIDSPWDSRPAPLFRMIRRVALALAGTGAAALSALKKTGVLKYSRNVSTGFELEEERFVVASTVDLTVRGDLTTSASHGAAARAVAELRMAAPLAAEEVDVMPAHEVEVA